MVAARRAPLAAFGIAWALAWWLPFANVLFATPVAFAERMLFASAAGVALAGAAAAWTAGLSRGLLAAAVLSLTVPAVVRLERRIPEWRDDRTLFEATVRDVPGNGRAWANLAVLALGARDDARAAAAAERAAAADPSLCPRLRALREPRAFPRTRGDGASPGRLAREAVRRPDSLAGQRPMAVSRSRIRSVLS